jgi:hypothetical protein
MDLVADADRRKVLVALPEPIDERLEWLLRVAKAAGTPVSRSQMLAAVIANTPTGPGELARIVQQYLSLDLPTFSDDHPHGDLLEVKHPGPQRR